MIRVPNSCPLKYPSWFNINLKFLLEVKIRLSIFLGTKNWTCLITGCTTTDWFKSVNSIEMRLWKPYQWVELILLIQHQEIYINNFASFYGFESLFFFELTNLNQSVLVQPVIKQVQIVFRRKMERWIFTSNNNFKLILNQLGYFKGQLFGTLIMKYEFSHSMISFIENDFTYHAKRPKCYSLSIK